MLRFLKTKYKLTHAFKDCFCDADGKLSESGKIVLAYLRDEACAKGEFGQGDRAYFYDDLGRFDANAALVAMGKRKLFDKIQAILALDEKDILNLIAVERSGDENLSENLNL